MGIGGFVAASIVPGLAWPDAAQAMTDETRAMIQNRKAPAEPTNNTLIRDLLAKSDAKREERYQERLDSYNRRNFKEYFELEQKSRAGFRGLNDDTLEMIDELMDKEGGR